MTFLASRGVGLGYRPELAADLVVAPHTVDFVEVVAESCFAQRALRLEAVALARRWPVIPHGVKLSLGSADGIDDARAKRLGALARELRAPLISEHVSFTRAGTREIGHLTQLPRTREAVRVVARNVARARRFLPDVPLLLENVAFAFRYPAGAHGDEMDEPTFYQEIVRATGCDLLLDVGNLYANAVNDGLDPAAVLAAYPLGHVAMLHVAGGVLEGGFYFDTHAHPIPAPVFDLVQTALAAAPHAPVLLERDASFGAFGELRAELERLRALRPEHGQPRTRLGGEAPCAATAPASLDLLDLQREVARVLTAPALLPSAIAAADLERARAILLRKRVDDSLPLLGRLGRHRALAAIAERVVTSTPRAPSGAGPADALRIAEAALADAHLRDDALVDALLLRARFKGPDASGVLAPRTWRFAGAAELGDGTQVHVHKRFGAFAPLEITERRRKAA